MLEVDKNGVEGLEPVSMPAGAESGDRLSWLAFAQPTVAPWDEWVVDCEAVPPGCSCRPARRDFSLVSSLMNDARSMACVEPRCASWPLDPLWLSVLPVLATLLGRLTTLLARLLELEPGMARRCGNWRPSRRLGGFAVGGDTDDEVEAEEGPTSDTVLLAGPATLPPRLLRRGPAEKEEEAERLPAPVPPPPPPPPPSTTDESRNVATLEPLACCGCSGGVLRGG